MTVILENTWKDEGFNEIKSSFHYNLWLVKAHELKFYIPKTAIKWGVNVAVDVWKVL